MVEEVRDITRVDIQETSMSRQTCNMEEDVVEKMDENDMQADDEREEDEGDSNSEGEDSSEDEEEGSGIKKKNESDVGETFEDEAYVPKKKEETFEDEVYVPKEKRNGVTKKAHGECNISKCDGCDKKACPTTYNIEDQVDIMENDLGSDNKAGVEIESGLKTDQDVGHDKVNDIGLNENVDTKDNIISQSVNRPGSGGGGHCILKEGHAFVNNINQNIDGSYGKKLYKSSEYDQVNATDTREKRDMSPTSSMEKTEEMSKKKRKSSHVKENGEVWCTKTFNAGLGTEENPSVNIRGFGESGKKGWVKSMVRKERPDMIGIQETKSGLFDEDLIEDIWGGIDYGYTQLTANGNSGGILLIWDKRVFTCKEAIGDERFIAVRGAWKGKDEDVFLVCIYGPHVTGQKASLWDRLSRMMNRWQGAWCIFGDLNVVRSIDDRLNSQVNMKEACEFNEFINNMRNFQLMPF
ncbi:hypothetical protein CTI12_AA466280 [Artemisia annua]|uniref:Endonuclease/exonuclease/phosphatase domain-containing protein n=1 Tax=Artemisia annua TaxID=35608 RepID=A0A2U1LR71_ARTAN|nr:hypothetical protein CTI12_AA466280 [Artemisia annua]